MKKIQDQKSMGQHNIERFYSTQNQLRQEREKESLIFGGYSHMAGDYKPGMTNIRTVLAQQGVKP